MGWRHAVIVALLACACCVSRPLPPPLPNNPSITRHTIEGPRIAYSAEAGLMPIEQPEGGRLGDMSYFGYTTTAWAAARPGRPIAFIWNGGPGSNTTPLHYGAFGPRRLQDGSLIANPNTLLDVADLVFIDQMEAGYGRIAKDIPRDSVLNRDGDAGTFALFIETFLKNHRIENRPIVLIGESYGVQRALRVAEKLKSRGIEPRGIVLISGYQAVGGQLTAEELGALRLPGFVALASIKKPLDALPGLSPQQVFDHTLEWMRPYLASFQRREINPDLSSRFAEELARLGGATLVGYVKQAIANKDDYIGNAFVMLAHDGPQVLDAALKIASAYDSRFPSDGSEWISRAIVSDIRSSLGFSIDRTYRGQEFDREVYQTAYVVGVADTSSEACGTTRQCAPQYTQPPPPPAPADGLAKSTVGNAGRFRTGSPIIPPPAPLLMSDMPDLKMFVAGGIFDSIFPCAVGDDMVRRDLAAFSARVQSKCYAGGHMMYFDGPAAHDLSSDVRAFMLGVARASR